MPAITALMIDSREPEWVKSLKFGGIPCMVAMLETGDVQAVTDDGCTLIVERKTPDDFLNTLRDERLFPQLARMVEMRSATTWPYLIITEPLTANREGKVITDRGVTGWGWEKVQGALLSIQELGIPVVYANGQSDYEKCILRIGRRSHDSKMNIMPAKSPNVLGPKHKFLAGIDGIDVANSQKILEWSGNNLGQALVGLMDLEIPAPVSYPVRKQLRHLMGLVEGANFRLDEPMCEPVQGEKGKNYE